MNNPDSLADLQPAQGRPSRSLAPRRERAAVVGVDFGSGPAGASGIAHDPVASLEELRALVDSAGADPIVTITAKRNRPDPALFVGSGKADEIAAAVMAESLDLVIFDHILSPAQQRNLERVLKVRVVDRTSLILDIFAQRAQSHEGKVQVELAQLRHLSTRLVRGWTHLERQKGGIGLRGPGETQLETDRRLLGERVKMLRVRLEKLERQRATQRRARARGGVFSVSIVGYTNAGKSTLFNALTHANVYAADQLFATLDTTSRRIYIEGAGQVVVSDTVGFIRDLPHALIDAFKATLEETVHADLLLHVVDASSPARMEQIRQVNEVLAEIGADRVPQILVWNKIDVAESGVALDPAIDRDECDSISRVGVSARTGAGLDLLRGALVEAANAPRAALRPAADARFDSRVEALDPAEPDEVSGPEDLQPIS